MVEKVVTHTPTPTPTPTYTQDLDGVLAYALIDLESGAPSFTPWEHMTTDLEALGGVGRRWEALGGVEGGAEVTDR